MLERAALRVSPLALPVARLELPAWKVGAAVVFEGGLLVFVLLVVAFVAPDFVWV